MMPWTNGATDQDYLAAVKESLMRITDAECAAVGHQSMTRELSGSCACVARRATIAQAKREN